MWKIFYNQVPNDLNIQFKYQERKCFCAAIKPLVKPNSKPQTMYDNSFAVVGPKLWNLVPKQIRFINTSVEDFKRHLSKFLELFPDHPPVNGYSRATNNSLLEISGTRDPPLLMLKNKRVSCMFNLNNPFLIYTLFLIFMA